MFMNMYNDPRIIPRPATVHFPVRGVIKAKAPENDSTFSDKTCGLMDLYIDVMKKLSTQRNCEYLRSGREPGVR